MIDILLATYNGEKYIGQQIDSILNQTEHNFRILIRDDNSTDRTPQIIQEYADSHENIVIVKDSEKAGGAVPNFFLLMKHATADYVMFCDQDDVWLPDKIKISLAAMKKAEKRYGKNSPILVYSDYEPVSEDLQPIKMDKSSNMVYKHYDQLNRLLIQNYITGCTMMINKRLCQIAIVPYSKEMLMHDWWIALCASSMGHIVYENKVTMYYRQHQEQSVGAIDVKSFRYRINKFLNPETKNMDKKCVQQAKYFLSKYGKKLPKDERKTVWLFANIEKYSKLQRMHILISGGYLKSDFVRVIGQLVYV